MARMGEAKPGPVWQLRLPFALGQGHSAIKPTTVLPKLLPLVGTIPTKSLSFAPIYAMQSRLELPENLNELAATRRIQMSWAQVLIGSREREREAAERFIYLQLEHKFPNTGTT